MQIAEIYLSIAWMMRRFIDMLADLRERVVQVVGGVGLRPSAGGACAELDGAVPAGGAHEPLDRPAGPGAQRGPVAAEWRSERGDAAQRFNSTIIRGSCGSERGGLVAPSDHLATQRVKSTVDRRVILRRYNQLKADRGLAIVHHGSPRRWTREAADRPDQIRSRP